jgi:hypothetical protein
LPTTYSVNVKKRPSPITGPIKAITHAPLVTIKDLSAEYSNLFLDKVWQFDMDHGTAPPLSNNLTQDALENDRESGSLEGHSPQHQS